MEPESRSAFKPGRPIFNEMLRMIDDGKADGLVFYSPSRASRNEIDAAAMTWRLREGGLKDIQFCTYSFENTSEGILMLQLLLSQSQYESAKQGKDVKRGMVQKAIAGERPGIVPTGYMKQPVMVDGRAIRVKDKLLTETVFDDERINLVKKMWKMLLSEKYTPRQIRVIANEHWHYTLRPTAKTGGKPIALSSIYRIFSNPFYAGFIVHEGEWHKGKHLPIITLDEFDRAQAILGKRGKPRNGVNPNAYTGLIRCGECGCSIACKTNRKFVKRDGKTVTYVHYFCIRKSDARPCTQTKYTRLEDLEQEIDTELSKYTILPEFRDLALEILNREHRVEVKERTQVYRMQQSKRTQVQDQLDKLVDMRTRGLLDDDEYLAQKNRLKQQLLRIDDELSNTEARAEDWLELTERAFDFATYARVHFATGDLQTKRGILMTLGENFLLKDNKLTLTPNEWLVPIGERYPALERAYIRKVGTNKKASSKDKEEALSSISESWRAR